MNEYEATALIVVAFFATTGFILWLMARYPRSSGEERERSAYTWRVEYTPRGGFETAPPRKPKPVPPVRPAQPNRRKKKKARR